MTVKLACERLLQGQAAPPVTLILWIDEEML